MANACTHSRSLTRATPDYSSYTCDDCGATVPAFDNMDKVRARINQDQANHLWDAMRKELVAVGKIRWPTKPQDAEQVPCSAVYNGLAVYAALRATRSDLTADEALTAAAHQILDHVGAYHAPGAHIH